MTFAVAFLGSLFAILAALAIVYSYVTLLLIPRIKRGFTEFVSEMGAKALMDQAGIDPRDVAGRSDLDTAALLEQLGARGPARAPSPSPTAEMGFACTRHGRCTGCPEIRDTFEAIARHQGIATMSPLELSVLEHLRTEFPREQDRSPEARS